MAESDKNVGDAKTNNDRHKHHHMLKLIVHSNARGADGRPNEFDLGHAAEGEASKHEDRT